MATILLVYSTTDGHTLTISQRLRQIMEACGHAATLIPMEQAETVDPAAFDRILIGARIRYGKHSPLVYEYIRRHQSLLESRPSGFFSVCVVARKPGRNRPETNPYMQKFLRRISWKPRHLAVFAGRIDYPRYGFLDRLIIRFIMWMTHGPTDPQATVEFTDWQAVEAFGKQFAA